MRFSYCPNCGKKLSEKEIGDEGKLPYCDECRRPWWDMFSSCVICVVVNEYDEIALIRQNYVSESKYVCVAGIIQIGETAEDTVIREVKEEIGLDITKLQYVKSSYYKKKEMLMLGYRAEVKKADFKLSREVDSAEWIPFSNVLSEVREGSIAWNLIKDVLIDTI